MKIRKDLQSAAKYLERFVTYADVFHRNNTQDWSHLRNKEDFGRVYELKYDDRRVFETIYEVGRDLAVHMTHKLIDFNYAEDYPTLTSYIESFATGWLTEIDQLTEISQKAKNKSKEMKCHLWSVGQMIILFDKQLGLLKSIQQTLNILKTTELYKIENGEYPMRKNKKSDMNITISNVSGKVNVNSSDCSTNYSINNAGKLFSNIKNSIESSGIDTEEMNVLLEKLLGMEQSVQTSDFSSKYKEFMQLAANHMSIIAPFIPALLRLL